MFVFGQIKRDDRPLWYLTVGVFGGLGILLAGLWYLQIVRTKRYVASQITQSVRTVRFPALRGKILDRQGQVLAENRPSYNINLYLEELSGPFQEVFRQAKGGRRLSKAEREVLGNQTRFRVVSGIVQQLGALLHQPLSIDESSFLRHYSNSLALPLPVLANATPAQVARFLEMPARLPGLNLDIQPTRFYPNQTVAAHVLGYLQRSEKNEAQAEEREVAYDYCLPDYTGLVGVEAGFDPDLRGVAGVKAVMVNNLGYRQGENIWSAAEPGEDLVLTLDLRIQRAAEEALHAMAPRGAVVVLDPRNGDLLALASAPTFDPNAFLPSISRLAWQQLNDPVAWKDRDYKPMINRATQGTYMPGSTFKIVVGLAGLEAGTLDPAKPYHSLGYYPLGPKARPIHDLAPAGDYNFYKAFIHSSNAYFAYQANQVGLAALMKMGQKFFLGRKVRLPLLQEATGFFPTPEFVKEQQQRGEPVRFADVAMLGIGQGYVNVTPLQMALMTAAIANGGKVFWPRLVERIELGEADDRSIVQTFPAGRLRGELGVNPANLQRIREAMNGDVEAAGATGRRAFVEGMNVCGKTGTAQFPLGHDLLRHDTWFVSFAPYEAPRYVVVVFVEGGGSGGGTCAPVAQRIYQAIKRLEGSGRSKPTRLAGAVERSGAEGWESRLQPARRPVGRGGSEFRTSRRLKPGLQTEGQMAPTLPERPGTPPGA